MDYLTFTNLILENPVNLTLSIVLFSFIYIIIMKRKQIALFSPFIFVIYNSLSADVNMFFLYSLGKVSEKNFFYFFIGEFLFFLAFIIKLPKVKFNVESNTKNKGLYNINDNNYSYIFFFITFLLFIFNKLMIYRSIGIPILMSSRNDMSSKGGGTGIFLRIDEIVSAILIYYMTYFLFIKKEHKLFSKITLIVYVLTILLSASKSGVLGFLCSVFSVIFLYRNVNPEPLNKWNRSLFKLIILASLFLIIGFVIQYSGYSINELFAKIGVRLLSQGDAVFLGFPKENFKQVESSGFFRVFFSDLLVTFRILPSQFSIPSIGHELYVIATGFDYNSGSVATHQIFGLIEFGYIGGWAFSFFCGLLTNIIYKNFEYNKSNCLNLFNFYLYNKAPLLNYALPAFLVSITNLLLMSIPILFVLFIVYYLRNNRQFNTSIKKAIC